MSKLLWLLGGTTLALAVIAILNAPDALPADGVERVAANIGAWGLKQRASGVGGSLAGKVKEFAGNVTGNQDASDEGLFDQATGKARNAAGQAAEALSSTIHDLNKA